MCFVVSEINNIIQLILALDDLEIIVYIKGLHEYYRKLSVTLKQFQYFPSIRF